jgi:hypothetical protein
MRGYLSSADPVNGALRGDEYLYSVKAPASPARAGCGRRWRAVLACPYRAAMSDVADKPTLELLAELVSEAVAALSAERHRIPEAISRVPPKPGLYAVHASEDTWAALGLEYRNRIPLYVGKAERSLQARDIRTHFATGRTGSSTVRRSFAALLRDTLGLRGVPRNQHLPERPANFGLEPEADERLTNWMHEHLALAYWVNAQTSVALDDIETGVIQAWLPPINLDKVKPRPKRLSDARKVMADDARAWTRDHGFEL